MAPEIAHQIAIPVELDRVSSPVVEYDGFRSIIHHYLEDEDHTALEIWLEHEDSLRICRGEYMPYESADTYQWARVAWVENSTWLQERYEYESNYYGSCYEWGGDVEEMLHDLRGCHTVADVPMIIIAKENFRNVPLEPRIMGPWAPVGPGTSYPESFFYASSPTPVANRSLARRAAR